MPRLDRRLLGLKGERGGYRLWRPDLGVPVRTSVGPPRWFQALLVDWPSVYPPSVYPPWALVRGGLDYDTYRRRYRHHLHRQTPKLLRELAELQTGYDAPLVLLCHCALSRPGAWCHRRFLA